MTYNMAICSGENNERIYQNPSPKAIDRAIDDLTPAQFHFVTLEAKPPVERCAYIQTLIEHEGRMQGRYLLEARYAFDGQFRHYKTHTADASEVKKAFRNYAEGVPPNTAGWEDITREL